MFEEPSPKRRKGDNMPPTAEDIARSNDHLHQLGVKRRSWMTGRAGPISPPKKLPSATSRSPKNNRSSLSTTTIAAANATAAASNARISSPGNGQQQPPKRPIADLVDYELPTDRLADRAGWQEAGRNFQRKEGAPNQRITLLPSPSPSEETARSPMTGQLGSNPPTPAIAQAAAKAQRSASRNGNVGIGSAGVPYTVPSNPPFQQTMVTNTNQDTIQRQPVHRSSVPSNVVPIRPTPTVPGQNASASPNLTHQRSMSGSAPPPLGQQQQEQQQQRPVQISGQQHQLGSMPFYRQEMAMKHVDHFESLLRQNRLGHYGESDMGRLSLVRQAVQNMDWFYVILNQVYCLRTMAPEALPPFLASLSELSWSYLASLLCDNRTLNPDFNNWSSMFPDRLSNIPREWQPAYHWYLHKVHSFLQALPSHWDQIVADSRARLAPPLVQELVDKIGVIGPTLQTTAFRCIARNFWPATGAQPGLEQLEAIHQKDQMSFAKGERLDQSRQSTTYAIYRGIFREWNGNHAMRPTAAVLSPPNAQPQQTRQVHAHGGHAMQRPPSRPSVNILQQQQQTALRQNSMAIPQQIQNRVPILAAQRTPHASPSLYQGQWAQPQVQQQHLQRGPKSVYPALHECPRAQPTHPDTNRVALHQAHLRSPLLGPKELPPGAEHLYRHAESFILPPKPLEPDLPVHTITFTLAPTTFAKIPQPIDTLEDVTGARPTIELTPNSRLYRLRCCKITPTNTTNSSHWATSDNFWPEQLSFTLNDKPLSMRRKLHHGRHLPISLSPFIQRGVNRLTASVTRTCDQAQMPFPYAISIEAVSILSHSQLTAQIPTIPASETTASIQKFLNPTKPTKSPSTANPAAAAADDDDDSDSEIEMISNTLSITLTDPYSGCLIFAVPVRGKTCLHRDCFDLETFLQQRRRDEPGWASAVDDWRCPICRGDARPSQLVVDGFLVSVRKELEGLGKLDTRAIVVGKDGSWRARVEKTTGVRSASLEVEERGEREAAVLREKNAGMWKVQERLRVREAEKAKQKRVIEVIELD